MFKRLLFICGLFFTIFTAPFEAQAQLSGTVSIIGRASSKTSDWTGISRKNRILVTLVNTRLQTYQGVLRVSISNGSGTQIAQTVDDQQTLIQVGIGSTLLDLEEVIAKNQGTFTFTDEALKEKLKNGFIPEDNYQICVDFLDVTNKRTLLNAPICRIVNVIAYQAPILVFPTDKSEVQPNTRPILRWNGVSPRPMGTVNYRLQVFEIIGEQTAEIAFRSNVALVTELISNQTQWIWSSSYPLPQNGKSYAWSVKAIDDEGNPIGETNGQAPPFSFKLLLSEQEKNQLKEKSKTNFTVFVKNKSTDKPLKALVKIKNDLQEVNIDAQTADDGSFTTADKLASDVYEIEASAEGYQPKQAKVKLNAMTKKLSIYLAPNPMELKGKIVSKHNNEPLSEVTVELFRYDKKQYKYLSIASLKTESDGLFHFKDIADIGEYIIKTKKKRYKDFTKADIDLVDGGVVKDLKDVAIGNEVMGIMYSQITGTVQIANREGEGFEWAENQELMLLNPADFRRYVDGGKPEKPIRPSAKTNADGEYEFKEVPVLPEGEQGYVVVAPETVLYKGAYQSGIVIVSEFDARNIELTVKRNTSRFVGTITDDDNAPIPNVKVELFTSGNGKLFKTTYTDDKGKYFIENAPVEKFGDITFSMMGVQSQTLKGMYSELKKEHKVDTKLSFFIDVKGTVKNQIGTTLSGVKVEIDNKSAITDAQGRYEIKQTSVDRGKTATLSLGKLSKKEKFIAKSGASYLHNATLIQPKKRIILHIIDENARYISNAELYVALTTSSNANSKIANKGTEFYTQKIGTNTNGINLTLDIPDAYKGQAIELSATQANLKMATIFLTIPEDTDTFFGEIHTLTLTMQSFRGTISGIVSRQANKLPIAGATVKLQGRNNSAITDSQGRYTFTDLKAANSYTVEAEGANLQAVAGTIRATEIPFTADQNLTLNLEMRGIQVNLSSLVANNTKDNKNKDGDKKEEKDDKDKKDKTEDEAVVKIFGFEVKITNAEKSSTEDVVLLDGYFLADKDQMVKPIATEKEKIQIPFTTMPFNTKTKSVCSVAGETVEKYELNLALPVVVNGEFRADMENMTVQEGIIYSESFIVSEWKSDDISLKNIKLTAESGATGIKPKANTTAPEFGVASIDGKQAKGAIALGKYSFESKSIEFAYENGSYSLAIQGGFAFQESPYKDNGKASVSFAKFSPTSTNAKMTIEGNAYVGADPVLIAGELGYASGLTLNNPNLVFKTGLGKMPMQGGSEEVAFISQHGKLSDITMYMGAETEDTVKISTFSGGVIDPNKVKPGTVSKHPNGKRKFFGGEIAIKNITARSDQENILTISINGDMKFELFSSPMAITEFTINSKKVVKFVVQKTNPSFKNPATGNMATTPVTERNFQRPQRTRTAPSSQNQGKKFSFELTSVTAEIKLDDPAASVFRIRGKLAFGIEAFRVKVGEIVIGGRTWGGSFGIEGGTKTWAASIEAKYVYTKEDVGDYKEGHNFGAKGSLWVNRSGTGTIDTTTNTRNPKEFRFSALFSYANAQNWSVALSLSSNSKDAPGNFQINKLGATLARAEMADVTDPSQTVTGWIVGGEIEMTKGEDLALEASFEVQTGNEATFTFMGDIEYTNVSGTKFKGRCDVYLNFPKQEYSGSLQLKVALTAKDVMVIAGFYVNGSNGEFAFMAGFEIPAPFFPAVDMGITVFIGNAIQKKFPASLVNKGFYAEGKLFKDWFFEKSIVGTGISASAGFSIVLGLGIDLANKGTEFVFLLAGNVYAKASVKVAGFEVAGVSAEARLQVKGSFNFKTKAFKARGFVNLVISAHINCSSCKCNNISMDLFGDGVGAKVCVDVGIGFRFRSDAKEPQKKFSWAVFGSPEQKDEFLAGADGAFEEEEKKMPEVPAIPQITSVTAQSLSRFTVQWRAGSTNSVAVSAFQLQVSETNNFKQLLVNEKVNVSVKSREIRLKGQGNKTYYVRMNAYKKDDEKLISDYTEDATITMPKPAVPTAKPFSNPTLKSFVMNWDDLKDESSYLIQVAPTKDFAEPTEIAVAKDIKTFDLSENVAEGGVYYYRVAAKYESEIVSDFSETIRVPIPISKPVIKEGTEALYSRFNANWEALPNCNRYLLFVSESPTFDSYIQDYGPAQIKETSTTVMGCFQNKKYYYRVQGGYSENRLSPFSESASVQTRPTLAPKFTSVSKISAYGFGGGFDVEGIDAKFVKRVVTQVAKDRSFAPSSTQTYDNRPNGINIAGKLDVNTTYYFRSRYVYGEDNSNYNSAYDQVSAYTPIFEVKTTDISLPGSIRTFISKGLLTIYGGTINGDEVENYTYNLYSNANLKKENLVGTDFDFRAFGSGDIKLTALPCAKTTYWVEVVPKYRRPLSQADQQKKITKTATVEFGCDECLSYSDDEFNLGRSTEMPKGAKSLDELYFRFNKRPEASKIAKMEVDISRNANFSTFLEGKVKDQPITTRQVMADGKVAFGSSFSRKTVTLKSYTHEDMIKGSFALYELPAGTYYFRVRTYNKACGQDIYYTETQSSFTIR